jgi:hypothetical protein
VALPSRRTTDTGLAFADNVSKWFCSGAARRCCHRVTPNHRRTRLLYLDIRRRDGDLRAFDGTNGVNNPMTFKNITSHDLKIGVRWDLQNPPVYQPPLIRKG